MQIDPYCQQWKCSLVNVVSSNIRVMQIFAGVREIWGIKQESGHLRCRFSYLSLAIFSKSSSPRLKLATHSICVKLLHKHDKLTQCCRAFTLALARLSCYKCATFSTPAFSTSVFLMVPRFQSPPWVRPVYGAEPHYSTLPFWQLCALKG